MYNVTFGGFLAMTVYLPGFFKDAYGKSVETSGYLGAMFTIIAACNRVPAGFISDHIPFMDGGIFMEYVCLIEVVVGTYCTTKSRMNE